MTTPEERKQAIKNTRRFLLDLLEKYNHRTTITELKNRSLELLKHYPSDYDVDDMRP